eukprot:2786746-Rhodomonas_salina.3
MLLLYEVMVKYPDSTLQGTFSRVGTGAAQESTGGVGQESNMWRDMVVAFKVLEEDFCRFDLDGDQLVDYTEITAGIPVSRAGQEKLNIMSRLEYAYSQVDLDRSGTLDFYEFMYLSFMMTQNGAYHDLVEESKGSQVVKKCFINIHSHYKKADDDGNLRLTYDELEGCLRGMFGLVPPEDDQGWMLSQRRVAWWCRAESVVCVLSSCATSSSGGGPGRGQGARTCGMVD